ncbi:MAG TPA: uroporphyrinogen-III C-methyltransferase [Moraxellaceae bacterium]|nr:uroporphyrinogen-III C-methyltransferase [Moraxellaceae bacterium]
MTSRDTPASESRIPLVSGAVIAVRSRPYLAYFLALGALGLGSYVWWSAREDAGVLHGDHDRVAQVESRLTDLRRQQQHLVDEVTLRGRELDELTARTARLDSAMNTRERRAWLRNEVDHYLHLAQQHLQLTRDVNGALALLDVADRLVAAQGDNDLLALRAAMAHDRQALLVAREVDVPGLYLRLGALGDRVAALDWPRGPAIQAAAAMTTASPAAAPAPTGWDRLRSLVIVRHHEQPLQPLMGDDARALAREALRLDIGQAQMGLLRGEPAIYQGSLRAARTRLVRDFALVPKAEFDSLQQEMTVLAAVDIRPALPDLDASLRALDALSVHDAGTSARVAPVTAGGAP